MEINIKIEICEKQVISLLAFTISAIFGVVHFKYNPILYNRSGVIYDIHRINFGIFAKK